MSTARDRLVAQVRATVDSLKAEGRIVPFGTGEPPATSRLTLQQFRIANLYCAGKRNHRIALILEISVGAVAQSLKRIARKLGLKSVKDIPTKAHLFQ